MIYTVRANELTTEKFPVETEKMLILDETRGAQGEGKGVTIKELLGTGVNQVSWFIPMTGVTDTQFYVTGELYTQSAGETGDFATGFGPGNQHIAILVNTITTGGDIVITGTSVFESTNVPMTGQTETLTVDETADQYYQTDKKWLEIDSINVSTGDIVSIDYDIMVVGYLDMGNRDFEVQGFRAEFRAATALADVGINIIRVRDDGAKKMSLVTLEDIGVDSTPASGTINDDLRTGADDRSLTFDYKAWQVDTMFVFKQLDFNDYFTNNENKPRSASKAEGIIISFNGKPSGGISGVDAGTITIFGRMR